MTDPIPNVRFTASKLILAHRDRIDQGAFVSQLVGPLKEHALNDSDPDVRHFASLALQGVAHEH